MGRSRGRDHPHGDAVERDRAPAEPVRLLQHRPGRDPGGHARIDPAAHRDLRPRVGGPPSRRVELAPRRHAELRQLHDHAGAALRPQRVVLGRASGAPGAADPGVADLERAQPAGLQLVRPAVRGRLRGAAARGAHGGQGGRPGREDRARRPGGHELVGAGQGLPGRREGPVRLRGHPPVHARAEERAEDPRQGPGDNEALPLDSGAQDVHHRADLARGQGLQPHPDVRVRDQRRAAGPQARADHPDAGGRAPLAAARARVLVHVDLGRAGAAERPVLVLGLRQLQNNGTTVQSRPSLAVYARMAHRYE